MSLDQVFILLQNEDFEGLQSFLSNLYPGKLADILEAMSPAERQQLCAQVPESVSADTISFLHDEACNSLINEMTPEELIEAVENMEVNDLADMIEDLPQPVRKTIEESLSDEIREHLDTNRTYSEPLAIGRLGTAIPTRR